MPTRIVLNEKGPPSPSASRGLSTKRHRGFATGLLDASAIDPRTPSSPSSERMGSDRASRRSLVGFRSSILRELSVRGSDDGEEEEMEQVEELETRVSSQDIRASPRLLGYMFCGIAAAVMLVSVVQFYRLDTATINPESADPDALAYSQKYYATVGGLVYQWKLWASIYISASGVGMCLCILLAHFDTVCLPKLWVDVFRDGSLAERNLIFFMILFWAAGVHASTSSLSVGEYQANVYFTTWIAFGSTALNYGVWRESAGLPTLESKVNLHHRETTYNWMWTAFFALIFAGSATDIYYNRNEIELRLRGEKLDLDNREWITILCVVWADFLVCILAILFNEWFSTSWQCPCVAHRPSGNYRCVFGWRQLEGLIILISAGGKFYVILEFTGVDGVINGLSNAYFGVWGSFFSSVFCFGTWLKENKNMEYFVKEETNE